jgi:hypothetical protein
MFPHSLVFAQNPASKDTLITWDESFETTAKFSAKDSIFNDFEAKQIHLFGEANVNYESLNLSAAYILIDLNQKEIFASF